MRLALLLLCVLGLSATEAPWAARAFAVGDGNRDGRLDGDELDALTRVLAMRGIRITPAQLLERYDTDGDGALAAAELGHDGAPPPPKHDPLPEGMTLVRDLAFAAIDGVDPSLLSLDLYLPAGAETAPVMVFIHGGGWRLGDKGMVDAKPSWLGGRGWIVASVNYRLSPAVQHPAHVQDVAAAIAWLHAHVAEHGGDPTRMVVMGHSAGAHLAALVACDPRWLGAHGLGLDALRRAVLLDGAGYDVEERLKVSGTVMQDLLIPAFGDDLAGWIDASPARQAAAGAPPFCITWSAFRPEAKDQAKRLADALELVGTPSEGHSFRKTHAAMNADVGAAGDPLTAAIEGFLDGLD